MRRRDAFVGTLIVMALAAMAACTSDDEPPAPDDTPSARISDAAAASTDSASVSSMPSAAPTASDRAAADAGNGGEPACPVSTRRPKDGTAPFAADVDADGRRDDVFLRHPNVGVRTAAGGFSQFEIDTAKPFSLLGAEDANGDGRDELFVGLTTGDDRGVFAGVQVAVFVDCRMRLARNVDGEPYTFIEDSRGKTLRGMGCVEIDGARRLVGLAGRELPDGRVRWKRTVVEMDGDRFTNGEVSRGTFTRPRDNESIRLLGEATCGENELAADYGS